MHKLNSIMNDPGDVDKDGLPKIDPDNIDNYIDYYENLIRKRTQAKVSRVRNQALKRIQQRYAENQVNERTKNLDGRLKEIKAFYEGDIVEMDKSQKNYKSTKKSIKWYEWDMVMVFPNPDFNYDKQEVDGYLLDDVDEAVHRYKKCFKQIYRENQVEMKKERIAELDLVRELVTKHLVKQGEVRNLCGGRFQKAQRTDDSQRRSGVIYEGGKEEMDIPEEDAHANQVKEMSINDDTNEEDQDPFIDTRVYCADFTTLILNAIIYRLNKHLGFETLLLMSKSGRDLYLLISASPGDLR